MVDQSTSFLCQNNVQLTQRVLGRINNRKMFPFHQFFNILKLISWAHFFAIYWNRRLRDFVCNQRGDWWRKAEPWRIDQSASVLQNTDWWVFSGLCLSIPYILEQILLICVRLCGYRINIVTGMVCKKSVKWDVTSYISEWRSMGIFKEDFRRNFLEMTKKKKNWQIQVDSNRHFRHDNYIFMQLQLVEFCKYSMESLYH